MLTLDGSWYFPLTINLGVPMAIRREDHPPLRQAKLWFDGYGFAMMTTSVFAPQNEPPRVHSLVGGKTRGETRKLLRSKSASVASFLVE